jgi:hypothetical protein
LEPINRQSLGGYVSVVLTNSFTFWDIQAPLDDNIQKFSVLLRISTHQKFDGAPGHAFHPSHASSRT